MPKVVFLPVALDNLLEITRYITHKLFAPQAARDFIKDINAAVDLIARYPYSCKLYSARHALDKEIRYLPVANYLLFYVVKKRTVEILHIRYSKRQPALFVSKN
jgi:plasmid stabilization system protein ParE